MDILSGHPTATDGSKYILVLVDAFTKWIEAYPLPDQEAHTCMRAAYDGFFSRFGFPLQLHSDQGRNFESSLVKELCSLTGVYKTRTTPFHPRSDGLTERANRTLLQDARAGQPARLACAFAFCPVCVSDDKALVYWRVTESGNAGSRNPPALCLDCSTPAGPVSYTHLTLPTNREV